jgi:hypothetical protein
LDYWRARSRHLQDHFDRAMAVWRQFCENPPNWRIREQALGVEPGGRCSEKRNQRAPDHRRGGTSSVTVTNAAR